MFQLSLTVLLALCISVNFVFTVEVFLADTANLQNESPVGALKNNNQTKESPEADEKQSRNVTRNNLTLERDQQKDDTSKEQAKSSSVTSLTAENGKTTSSVENVTRSITRPTEETTPVTEEEVVTQKVGNFTGEQANLNQCCVNPPDEDEKDVAAIETPKETTTSAGTMSTLPVVTIKSTTTNPITTDRTTSDTFVPPKFFPVTTDVKSIANMPSDVVARLNLTMYKTFPPHLDDVTETTTLIFAETTNATVATTIVKNATTSTPTVVTSVTTNASTVLNNNQTKNGNGKMAVEGLGNLQQAELSEKSKESNDGSKDKSMPSGIIALVTAISFLVAIAIGYISMVVWKQYLEHRYGRRELLVNELEFDTNDLRHFEL